MSLIFRLKNELQMSGTRARSISAQLVHCVNGHAKGFCFTPRLLIQFGKNCCSSLIISFSPSTVAGCDNELCTLLKLHLLLSEVVYQSLVSPNYGHLLTMKCKYQLGKYSTTLCMAFGSYM